VIRGIYDARCDIWGVGVISYLLLCGDSPFGGCDASGIEKPLHIIRSNILSGKFKFQPEHIWKDVSQDAKDFITALLTSDVDQRPTAKEARNLKFLRKYDPRGSEDTCELDQIPCFKNPIFAPIISKLQTMKINIFDES